MCLIEGRLGHKRESAKYNLQHFFLTYFAKAIADEVRIVGVTRRPSGD